MAFNNAANWLGANKDVAAQVGVGAAAAGLGAWGDAQQRKAQRQQNAAQMAQTDYWNTQSQQTNRASGVLNADPLGADQRYAQRNALMASILPNLRNFHSPEAPERGGFMNALGPNGLDPTMINNLFGSQATMAAIGKRNKELLNLDPRAPVSNLSAMYGSEADGAMDELRSYATAAQNADSTQRAEYDARIKALIDQKAAGDKPGGFWHNLAKVAAVAGGIAATAMTGGAASPLLIGAVGAGSGALGAWGNGSNPLMGAVLGGASSYMGARGAAGTGLNRTPTNINYGGMRTLPAASLGAATQMPSAATYTANAAGNMANRQFRNVNFGG